jgi:hypothetical protein
MLEENRSPDNLGWKIEEEDQEVMQILQVFQQCEKRET